ITLLVRRVDSVQQFWCRPTIVKRTVPDIPVVSGDGIYLGSDDAVEQEFLAIRSDYWMIGLHVDWQRDWSCPPSIDETRFEQSGLEIPLLILFRYLKRCVK